MAELTDWLIAGATVVMALAVAVQAHSSRQVAESNAALTLLAQKAERRNVPRLDVVNLRRYALAAWDITVVNEGGRDAAVEAAYIEFRRPDGSVMAEGQLELFEVVAQTPKSVLRSPKDWVVAAGGRRDFRAHVPRNLEYLNPKAGDHVEVSVYAVGGWMPSTIGGTLTK